jgi:hypothetical protein
LLVVVVIVFSLACNLVTQPFEDVQDSVETVQAVATAMPLETLQALATSMPIDTLEALPNDIPNIGNVFDPQGEPVAEWNEIPIMPEASAGQAFDTTTYSFKVDASLKEIVDYYDARLGDLGWANLSGVIEQSDMTILVFTKENRSLTITLTPKDGYVLVMLILT